MTLTTGFRVVKERRHREGNAQAGRLPSHAEGIKPEHDVPPVHRKAKIDLGTEPGKQQNLIHLPFHRWIVRTRKYPVGNKLPLRIHGRL